MFVDPDTFHSTFSFLYLKDVARQDADGIVKAIKSIFSFHDQHHVWSSLQVIGPVKIVVSKVK